MQPVATLHVDVETYTWSVLPGPEVDLVDGIAADLRWAEAELLERAELSASTRGCCFSTWWACCRRAPAHFS